MNNTNVKLLDFWAEWCGPCKRMEPILEELESELKDKVEIVKINVDEEQDKAMSFGVMSIPTYIITKDDKEVARKVGFTTKQELMQLVKA